MTPDLAPAAVRRMLDRIEQAHAGRDPERLRMKDALLRSNPLSFMRGTALLFWDAWPGLGGPDEVDDGPAAWTCGDLHAENFGSFKGRNRLVYFDINDFDEACLAPASWDVARLLTSLRVAARWQGLGELDEAAWVDHCLGHYQASLLDGHPLWIERATAHGPVRTLLQQVRKRRGREFVPRRAVLGPRPHLRVDGRHALPLPAPIETVVAGAVEAWLRERLDYTALSKPVVLDVARRVAGNGSLGVERYAVLAHRPNGRLMLIDVKCPAPSSAAEQSPYVQPAWASEAQRVVSVQSMMQAAHPALLGTLTVPHGKLPHACVVRELLPSEDRVSIAGLVDRPQELADLFQTLGQILAWNQLRASGRQGADSADALIAWAASPRWANHVEPALLRRTHEAASRVMRQWQAYARSAPLWKDES